MLWIVLAVLLVSIIAGLAGLFDPLGGDPFQGIMLFLLIWIIFAVVMLFIYGIATLSGHPFVWVWV